MRSLWVLVLILMIGFNLEIVNAKSVTKDDLLSVSFPNERQGWASGRWGVILHTQDGGRSWTKQHSGIDYTLTSIIFVDSKNGWAVGEQGTIIHTQDAGKTWEKQKSNVPYFLMGVYFVSPLKGWIVGEQTHILHTVDGGGTWRVQFSGEDFILKSISFADDRNGWTVGEFGYIYHTKDGGKNWQLQAGEFGFSEETGEMVGGNYLFDVTAISPLEVWAVGIEGHITYSINGGNTWSSPVGDLPEEHLLGVAAVSDGTVVTTGRATINVTTDHGRTWRQPEIVPPIKYGWLYGVAQRGNKGFVAVGKEGWIYQADTTDGTWKLSENR
jgi:photosystem II stability/assembly factor-like uncharacterized protein